MNEEADNSWFAATLRWVVSADVADSEEWASSTPQFPDDWDSLKPILDELASGLRSQPAELATLLDPAKPRDKKLIERLNLLCRNCGATLQRALLDSAETDDLAKQPATQASQITEIADRLYRAIHSYSIRDGESLFLQVMAWTRTDQALQLLVRALIEKPPHDWSSAAMGLSPLMRSPDWNVNFVFPELLNGIHEPSLIVPILDLANFCVHSKLLDSHPIQRVSAKVMSMPDAEQQVPTLEDSLTQMLGGVVTRLGLLEEDPTKFGNTPEKIQRVLNDAIALCVSLSDTLGLLRFEPAIGKLHQALQIGHRRVQTEAAAALARMNQPYGIEHLVSLASEPTTRLRVLAYAEELDLTDKIDPINATPQARAESELALWLADPQQFGIAPHSLELIDHRVLSWPSYQTPQECWLFRFQYQLAQTVWSNVGIAGPLTHAFAADLAELPIADIYSAFAGWQAEHPEIYELPATAWNVSQRRVAESTVRYLADHGHREVKPLWLGFFLGEVCLVSQSQVDGVIGTSVTDGLEVIWYPSGGRLRPVGPLEAYSIFKGRRMLRTFNPDFVSDLESEQSSSEIDSE